MIGGQMVAQIIDGKKMAAKIAEDLTLKVANVQKKPNLAVILVGDNDSSQIYVRNKQKLAENIGMKCSVHHLNVKTQEGELLSLLNSLNKDKDVNGIIVQMPLPEHINANKVLENIALEKDVDGFSPYNMGLLHSNCQNALIPATPKAVLYMLEHTLGNIAGKNAVIIGRSNIVGRPLASLLLNNDCTVTIGHKQSVDLQMLAAQADILVSACGVPQMVDDKWVKEGATVIDVGITRLNGKICGDVDFAKVAPKAQYITPVPGGVGPMTVAMLMQNTWLAYEKQSN